MTLQEASKIMDIYGIYLEYIHGNLSMLFFGSIPESILPFSKEKIQKALDMMIDYHRSMKNNDAVDAIQNSVIFLDLYVEDKNALNDASKRFADEEWQSLVLSRIKNVD
jgi:hypothetical protein